MIVFNGKMGMRKFGSAALPFSKVIYAVKVYNREADGKVVDGKVAYSKDIGSGKVSSKKVSRFLADFALPLLSLSTKSYKERLGIYFLKLY